MSSFRYRKNLGVNDKKWTSTILQYVCEPCLVYICYSQYDTAFVRCVGSFGARNGAPAMLHVIYEVFARVVLKSYLKARSADGHTPHLS